MMKNCSQSSGGDSSELFDETDEQIIVEYHVKALEWNCLPFLSAQKLTRLAKHG